MPLTFVTTATPLAVIREADRVGAPITLTEQDVPAGYVAVFRVLNERTAPSLLLALANAGERVAAHREPKGPHADETVRRVTRDPFTFG